MGACHGHPQTALSRKNRDVDSLRRKSASPHRKKTPTGYLLCPQSVRKAKTIRQKMTERENIGDGEDVVDLIGTASNTPNDAPEGINAKTVALRCSQAWICVRLHPGPYFVKKMPVVCLKAPKVN